MSTLTKIEETYLKLFKVVLLLILSIALLAAIGLGIKGAVDSMAEPQVVAPPSKAPAPSVNFEEFIKSIEKPDEPAAVPVPPKEPQAPRTPQVDPLDKMVNMYIENAAVVYEGFEKNCLIEKPMSRDDFLSWEGLRIFFRKNFEDFGEPFAQSQDQFIKRIYTDPRVVEICIQKEGKGQLFAGGLEWHLNQWIAVLDAAENFDREARNRVQSERMLAGIEAEATQALGIQMLWAALISFGVFMSLALLLIFSKIETNLREVRSVNANNPKSLEKDRTDVE
jgi:hypothetical protein